jgi:ubiquinone/menaquinone biosynthesis C-methylase UbiE
MNAKNTQEGQDLEAKSAPLQIDSAEGTHSPDVGQDEASRIRAAYSRRKYTIPRDRYSLFKKENFLAHLELQQRLIELLRRFQHADLDGARVLDVGCGTGYWLRQFVQWGARPENLFGIDLLQERVEQGRVLCPQGVTLQSGDATKLVFDDKTFDLVLQFTVFTSILDPAMKRNVAKEMIRVLKPRGAVIWYDYFVSNPYNPDVRGVTREEISQLFPGLSIILARTTLAPPLGRAIAPISPSLYRAMSVFKPLCTHYVGYFQKP